MITYEVQHLDTEGGVLDAYEVTCEDIAEASALTRAPNDDCAIFIKTRSIDADTRHV